MTEYDPGGYDPFKLYTPDAEQIERIKKVREAYAQVYAVVLAHVGFSRERSVALTELETSAMWAIKAIVTEDVER